MGNKVFGVANGIVDALLASEVGCDRGGKGTARTVGVGRFDRFGFENLKGFAVVKNVNTAQIARHTAPFYENDFRAEAVDASGGSAHVVEGVDF